MKKFSFFFVMVAFLSTMNTYAQKFYVYDSVDFNVMIKTNTENTRVLEISFTDDAKTKWIKFEIEDFFDYEDTDKGGFTYLVRDGKNDRYYVDYYRTTDYIVVSKVDDPKGYKWTLYRRPN